MNDQAIAFLHQYSTYVLFICQVLFFDDFQIGLQQPVGQESNVMGAFHLS